MGLRSIHIGILLVVFSTASSQFSGIELGISKNYRMAIPHQGFDPGGNGGSFRTRVNFDIGENILVKIGSELGANGIGNYLSSTAGIFSSFDLPGKKFFVSCGLSMQHGFVLFYPASQYLFGISEENVLYYRFKNGNRIGIFLEFRYFSSPAYAQYSIMSSFIDLQSGLSFSFL